MDTPRKISFDEWAKNSMSNPEVWYFEEESMLRADYDATQSIYVYIVPHRQLLSIGKIVGGNIVEKHRTETGDPYLNAIRAYKLTFITSIYFGIEIP